MNVDPVVNRLKELLSPEYLATVTRVSTAEEAAELLKNNKANAFVMFTSEGGGEAHGGTGATTQRITYRFMVLLGIQGAGAKGFDMEGLRDRVKDNIMGWTPAGAETPCVLVSSRVLLKDDDRALFFLNSEFQTTYFIRKVEVT